MKRRTVLAAIAMCWGMAMPTAAAAQAPVALTLADAVQRGIAHAPRLAEARAKEAAADATVSAATADGRPAATLQTGYLRTNHVEPYGVPTAGGGFNVIFPDIPNNYRVRGELTVPLYTGGRVDALTEGARSDRLAATSDRRAAEADVRLDVVRAYWTLVMARASVSVLEQALARADAWVRDVRAGVEAGLLPPNDLLSAQAQRARQNVRLIQARNADAVAEMDLDRLVGQPLGTPLRLTSPLDQPMAGSVEVATLPVETLGARALADRAERDALVARQAGLRSAAAAALSAHKPVIAAIAALEPSRPNPRFVPRTDEWRTSWDLGVNLTWSIFDAGRASARQASASAQAGAVGHRLEEFDELVDLEVRRRRLDIESGRAALAASEEAVAAAAEAQRVVEERFRAGVATSSDVLDAQAARLDAELERTRLSTVLRLSEAQLLRAIGSL